MEVPKPVSADVLLEREMRGRRRFTGRIGGVERERERVSTGCGVLDGVFGVGRAGGGSGVERGVVLGVSGGDEAVLISLHLLTSILLPHLDVKTEAEDGRRKKNASTKSKANVKAAIITTTSSAFPLSLLSKILKSRLLAAYSETALRENDTGNHVSGKDGGGVDRSVDLDVEVEGRVKRAMEMISLTRVFDIEGLDEILTDLSSPLPSPRAPAPAPSSPPSAAAASSPKSKPDEIIDSQASDISLSPEPMEKPTTPIANPETENEYEDEDEDEDEEQGIEILIISPLTPLITSHLSHHEKTKAHRTLKTLSHTLHTLTKTQNLLTVLHNTLLPPYPNQPVHPSSPPPHPPKPTNPNPPKPIFTSNQTTRPSLPQIFPQFLHLHLLSSPLPKHRRDAELVYTSPTSTPAEKAERCLVLEILLDETPHGGGYAYAAREESWVPVEVSGDGLGFVAAFASPSGAHPPKQHGSVSNVAKVWGFGGRRV